MIREKSAPLADNILRVSLSRSKLKVSVIANATTIFKGHKKQAMIILGLSPSQIYSNIINVCIDIHGSEWHSWYWRTTKNTTNQKNICFISIISWWIINQMRPTTVLPIAIIPNPWRLSLSRRKKKESKSQLYFFDFSW